MRLVNTGRGQVVLLPGTACVTKSSVAGLLQAHVHADGTVETLCLDFASENVLCAPEHRGA
jgi:adenylylsulfate kinase-like enzyme